MRNKNLFVHYGSLRNRLYNIMDGYAVNIGDCNAKPGQYVDALVDQKTKERAALMNPTS